MCVNYYSRILQSIRYVYKQHFYIKRKMFVAVQPFCIQRYNAFSGFSNEKHPGPPTCS